MSYDLYHHAGEIPFDSWKVRGVKVPVFDLDNTLSSFHGYYLIDKVRQGFYNNLPVSFPDIAIATNSREPSRALEFASILNSELGVSVLPLSSGDGYRRKPHPQMGIIIAEEFVVDTSELGIIGDRRLVDVRFGQNLGASAIALCEKQGDGDAPGVGALRIIEAGIVRVEIASGVAHDLRDNLQKSLEEC